MADYERSKTIHASAHGAYGYLSDPIHMPDWVAAMSGAWAAVRDLVGGSADAGGQPVGGGAMFHADPLSHRLEWGREGSAYSGWLTVDGDDAAEDSTVTIHLHTEDDSHSDEVEHALDDTMANIERALAEAGDEGASS